MQKHWMYPYVIALAIILILAFICIFRMTRKNKINPKTKTKPPELTHDQEQGDISSSSQESKSESILAREKYIKQLLAADMLSRDDKIKAKMML